MSNVFSPGREDFARGRANGKATVSAPGKYTLFLAAMAGATYRQGLRRSVRSNPAKPNIASTIVPGSGMGLMPAV